MTILIKGGHVINPATQMDEVADVLIEDQKIKKIGKELPEKEAERVINADGCYVMPGFIDMHVHFRDPGFEQKEDIYTGMQAAIMHLTFLESRKATSCRAYCRMVSGLRLP